MISFEDKNDTIEPHFKPNNAYASDFHVLV